MTLAQIAEAVGGEVYGDPGTTVTGPAYLDSREQLAGGLFVALAGERADGHDFVEGAHAVLGSRPTSAPTVVVADPVVGLGTLARHVVDRLDLTLLALTGSQGKTGTKDYLAAVLADAGPTVATTGNRNNELGVPITVLHADTDTSYLVVEMGARGIGHVRYLCDIAPPRIAAVLNVGTAHIAEFGSSEAIATAKGEIVEALPADGTAVLNADDERTAAMVARTSARPLTFGERGDLTWRNVELDGWGRPSFELGYLGSWLPVSLTQTGRHQVSNAAAAAAMAVAAGVPFPDVVASLGTATSTSRWRMEVHERADGLLVINDAYNANPASMVAALDALAGIGASRGRRTVAVLGEMKELGDDAERSHRAVGRAAAELGIDVVLVIGTEARGIAEGVDDDTWEGAVVGPAGRDQAIEWLRKNVSAEDVVLVKASRGVALEVVADELLEGGTGAP